MFIDTAVAGRVPAFEEVEAEVKTAWLGEQKALAWQKAYKDMRAKYTVLLPAVPETLPSSAAASQPANSSAASTARPAP